MDAIKEIDGESGKDDSSRHSDKAEDKKEAKLD